MLQLITISERLVLKGETAREGKKQQRVVKLPLQLNLQGREREITDYDDYEYFYIAFQQKTLQSIIGPKKLDNLSSKGALSLEKVVDISKQSLERILY